MGQPFSASRTARDRSNPQADLMKKDLAMTSENQTDTATETEDTAAGAAATTDAADTTEDASEDEDEGDEA